MAYLALYRKYRPDNFDSVVGQQGVVKALQNQVRYGQIGHAYLFCGTRGTGKTSMARVFAKAVNCQNPKDGMACGECECCRASADGMNIIEIDAASNNGVDNVRDLRDEVVYTPIRGKYKIYIIDEAHMLSSAAFNALLKTLEEPPEHAIFILATTEPNKLLPTIISRCQRYDFKRLTSAEIIGRLKYVCQREGIQADDEAIETIAGASDGGMRDALSLLDQCACYYIHEPIDATKVRDVLGSVTIDTLATMSRALVAGDGAGLILGVDQLYRTGKDADQFIADWLVFWRAVMLYSALGDKAKDYVFLGTQAQEAAKQMAVDLAKTLSARDINFYIVSLSALANRLRVAVNKRICLEAGLLEMRPEAAVTSTPSMQKPAAMPLATPVATPVATPSATPAATPVVAPEPVEKPAPTTTTVEPAVAPTPVAPVPVAPTPVAPAATRSLNPQDNWGFLKNKVAEKDGFLAMMMEEVTPMLRDENTVVLHCDSIAKNQLDNSKNKEKIAAIFAEYCGHTYEILFADPLTEAQKAKLIAQNDTVAKLNSIPGIKFQ